MAGRPRKLTEKKLILAAYECGGIISSAAKALSVSRPTIYEYIDRYPAVKDAFEDASEHALDESESVIFRLRDKAKSEGVRFAAARFHLQAKGKKRGYGMHLSLEHDFKAPEGFAIDIVNKPKADDTDGGDVGS